MLHYWTAQQLPDTARAAIAQDWVDDLAEFSPEIVAEACTAWRRSQTRRPTPADLRELCGLAQRRSTRIALPPPERHDAAAIRAEIRRQKQQEYREAALYRERMAHAEGYADFAAWYDQRAARWKTIIADSAQEEREKEGEECPL